MDTTVVTTAVAEATTEMQYVFSVTPENLTQTVPIMGKGMLGIFVVTAVVVTVVNALNSIPDKKNK